MTEQDTGLHHAVAPGVTRDETRNTFDEDRLTFGEAGSSSEAKRWHSAVRSVPPAQEARAADAHHSGGTQTGHQTDRAGVRHLISTGYLSPERREEAAAVAIALEAWIYDNVS